jgi:HCOMODA/2-hydroxy-3-carboxy-muconic semialdehyde decarboxylase
MCTSLFDDPAAVAETISDDAGATKPADAGLLADLATANRILFKQGVVDGFGHVSARHDKHPDRFLLARNMAPGLVTADDIVTFDLDGRALNANGRAVYLERFIHAEIFRARPDVMAVVHSHNHISEYRFWDCPFWAKAQIQFGKTAYLCKHMSTATSHSLNPFFGNQC